jgi:NADH-quinone oxidoreductase subunit M
MIISIGIYGLIIADDLFVFFLFYEIAVVPMFLIITNWGYDLKREVSGPFERVLRSLSVGTKSYGAYKITLYLLVGSLLIFLGLGVLGINEGTFSINEIISRGSLKTNTNLAFFLLAIGFGSHSALWPLHTWAPDGHGTAPTAGSIIFAGILMKIGIIGFIKIIITIFNPTFIEFSNILIILASINIIYGAFTAMMQDDLKYLAAYASLSHIGYIFLALAMNNQIGLNSALLQTASHGIIICLLFFSVGLIFNAKGTRSIKELNSLHDNAPIISSIFIFSAFASIGFPLTSGFIAEFLIINSIALSNNAILIIIPLIGIFITTLYMFRTVKKICLQYVETNNSYSTISIDEKLICYILIVLIVGIGIFPNFFLNFINGESIKILVGI